MNLKERRNRLILIYSDWAVFCVIAVMAYWLNVGQFEASIKVTVSVLAYLTCIFIKLIYYHSANNPDMLLQSEVTRRVFVSAVRRGLLLTLGVSLITYKAYLKSLRNYSESWLGNAPNPEVRYNYMALYTALDKYHRSGDGLKVPCVTFHYGEASVKRLKRAEAVQRNIAIAYLEKNCARMNMPKLTINHLINLPHCELVGYTYRTDPAPGTHELSVEFNEYVEMLRTHPSCEGFRTLLKEERKKLNLI